MDPSTGCCGTRDTPLVFFHTCEVETVVFTVGTDCLQWCAKVFGHHLKTHTFFKINPNDLSVFDKLEGVV